MKEIVKVLLNEGIDEETIHEVLDVLEGLYPYDVKADDVQSHKSVERHAKKALKHKDAETKETEKEYAKASDEVAKDNGLVARANYLYNEGKLVNLSNERGKLNTLKNLARQNKNKAIYKRDDK